jgi:RIO-like serine/threonine protein kinase
MELLKRDLWAETARDGDWVVKRSRLVPWLARHERAIYARLAGIPGVPRLHPARGDNWFAHEYVPGRTLRGAAPPPGFFDDLERLLRQIHARGVAYADLSKKSNVIVGDDCRAYLVDFQISVVGARWLMREDLYHLQKLRGGPRRRSPISELHRRWVRQPYLAVRRLFCEHAADEPA